MSLTIIPHLGFNGDCAEAFAFYADVLGGKITFMMTNGESPMKDQFPVDLHRQIVHATLMVGDQYIMGADAPPHTYKPPVGYTTNLQFSDLAEGEKVFKALVHGGAEVMAFGETFWSKGFGMCVDKYGQLWMVITGELM
jgi:PhnB protein